MIILVLSLILFLVLLVLYVMRSAAKQKQHLDKLKQAMNERRKKEEDQSRIAKERTLSS
jgi:predicted Holliday junction resolvase-like endonuclease